MTVGIVAMMYRQAGYCTVIPPTMIALPIMPQFDNLSQVMSPDPAA